MESSSCSSGSSACTCLLTNLQIKHWRSLPIRTPSKRSVLGHVACATALGCRPTPAVAAAQAAPLAPRQHHPKRGASVRSTASDQSSDTTAPAADEPQLAGAAIEAGLRAYSGGDTQGALQLFQRSLRLPGTGLKRYRDKPREISDEEKQAALYNTACCLGKMGEQDDALKAVAGCLDSGFTDYSVLRRDPDLAPVRESPKFEGLLKRFEPGSGFLSGFLNGFN